MLVLDPVTEGIEQIDILKQGVVATMPTSLEGPVGELLSWMIALGIQTPYGSLSFLVTAGIAFWFVLRPLLTSLLLAPLAHILILLSGGAKGGIGATFRAFGLNRANVEFASMAVALVVAWSPIPLIVQIPLLFVALALVKVIGLCVLGARLIYAHELGPVRIMLFGIPTLVVSSLFVLFLTIVPWTWVSLYCVARTD